jgi:predicted Fe-S protein YdhL (DUF1289 family)
MISNNLAQVDVVSPCVKLCKIDASTSLCQGCLRTLEEITLWSKANSETKLAIWKKIEVRKSLAAEN